MPGFNIKFSSTCDDGPDIPGARSLIDGADPYIETARVHRYKLEIFDPLGGLSSTQDSILLYLARCTRPTPEIDEITIHNAQDEIYRPGKNRWRPIEFTFYEVLKTGAEDRPPDVDLTAESIFRFWAERTVNLQTSRFGPPTGSNAYCADAQLDMLNGVGDPIWTYDIYRAWPSKVSPKDLNYSNSEISEISVTLRFDKANERR